MTTTMEFQVETCPICCKPVSMPYRYCCGGYSEGCVHACHDAYIPRTQAAQAAKVRAKIKKLSKL